MKTVRPTTDTKIDKILKHIQNVKGEIVKDTKKIVSEMYYDCL